MQKDLSQVEGVDYHETFAPTTKMTSIRTMANVVAQHDMVVHQLDVKSAYLHAPIDCELYLEPPQGFREGNDDKAVWKLECIGILFYLTRFNKIAIQGTPQMAVD